MNSPQKLDVRCAHQKSAHGHTALNRTRTPQQEYRVTPPNP